jgi:hypothetical protein
MYTELRIPTPSESAYITVKGIYFRIRYEYMDFRHYFGEVKTNTLKAHHLCLPAYKG